MAINFEAANMAGYNNPKIEVFTAVADSGTLAVASAPSKTELIRCIHRGSIPAIMTTFADGSSGHLQWLVMWTMTDSDYSIFFSNGSYVLFYPAGSEHPLLQRINQ